MIDMNVYKKKAEETVSFLQGKIKTPPAVVIILGTGLGGLIDSIEVKALLPYEEIPNFPHSTVPGHHGNLVFGTLRNRDVAVLQGRFHYYEGYSTRWLQMLPVALIPIIGQEPLW
jgi:purine-nucleoside phosphorylase